MTISLTATNRCLLMSMATFLLALAFTASVTNAGEPVVAALSGQATIIDGDTIDIGGQRIRLHGIDAPEARQTCTENGEEWSCGQQSTLALTEFINQSFVTCEGQGTDRYSRIIATCYVRGDDIEAWMVSNGWALAYRKYSTDYVGQEQAAQAARRGVWRGEFVPPWEWRRGKRLQAATAPDSAGGCTIKGNISSSGERIYHIPGAQHYDRTKINTAEGERWFCSETEAVAAGWRKSKR